MELISIIGGTVSSSSNETISNLLNSVGKFTLSVLASLVAGIILIVITSFLSSKFRWILIAILNTLVSGDLENIFHNSRDAQSTLINDLKNSDYVYILTGRGGELSRETFAPLFHRLSKRSSKVELKLLLPSTDNSKEKIDWTAKRAEELNSFNAGSGSSLASEINTNAESIATWKYHQDGNIEIRRYNVPHLGRIIITQKYVYFTPYQDDRHGKDTAIYIFRHGGVFYKSFNRLFFSIWEAYQPN